MGGYQFLDRALFVSRVLAHLAEPRDELFLILWPLPYPHFRMQHFLYVVLDICTSRGKLKRACEQYNINYTAWRELSYCPCACADCSLGPFAEWRIVRAMCSNNKVLFYSNVWKVSLWKNVDKIVNLVRARLALRLDRRAGIMRPNDA